MSEKLTFGALLASIKVHTMPGLRQLPTLPNV